MRIVKALLFMIGIFHLSAFAGSKIQSLEVNGQVVTFSVEAAKAHQTPACMTAENSTLWSLSLDNQSDRANYSLLLTAMTMGLKVEVESAEDCGNVAGIERAKRVWYNR